jgi:hypothetical protein
LLALLSWWTIRLATADDPWCFLDYVNLAFHEAGHLAFAPFGSTLHVLGGTLAQLLLPVGLGLWFALRERRFLPAALCVWWLGESLVNTARYMRDARDLALPLVGGGDHDWNELFYRFDMLTEAAVARVSGATHAAGVMVMVVGLTGSAVLVLTAAGAARAADRASRTAGGAPDRAGRRSDRARPAGADLAGRHPRGHHERLKIPGGPAV